MGKCVVLLLVLVTIAAMVHEGESWRRFRFRVPRFRFRIPRIRLPRFRLPRIRLPRFRLPRIRIRLPRIRLPRIRFRLPFIPKPPQCPTFDTSNFLNKALCTSSNEGCMNLCNAFAEMLSVQGFHRLCPVACQEICKLNLGKRDQIASDQDDFASYDENKDQKITSEELSKVLKLHSREVDDSTLGKFFAENDVNSDGFLDNEEFLKMTEKDNDDDTEEFLREMEDEDEQTDDQEQATDEEKRNYLEGLQQRLNNDELTEDDMDIVAQLEEAQADEE